MVNRGEQAILWLTDVNLQKKYIYHLIWETVSAQKWLWFTFRNIWVLWPDRKAPSHNVLFSEEGYECALFLLNICHSKYIQSISFRSCLSHGWSLLWMFSAWCWKCRKGKQGPCKVMFCMCGLLNPSGSRRSIGPLRHRHAYEPSSSLHPRSFPSSSYLPQLIFTLPTIFRFVLKKGVFLCLFVCTLN